MKHLKKFNERLESVEVDELKDFCETSLAYLLDDGFNVDVSIRNAVKYPGKNHVIVSLNIPTYGESGLLDYKKFHWNDVKDYYIPFLQMLVRRYELLPYGYFNGEIKIVGIGALGFDYFSLDEVIDDTVSGMNHIGSRLWGINLKIVDKI